MSLIARRGGGARSSRYRRGTRSRHASADRRWAPDRAATVRARAVGPADGAVGATRRRAGAATSGQWSHRGGPWRGRPSAPPPPPPRRQEAAHPAPEPRQPRARRRLRRRLVGDRDRRHVGADRLRAARHRQRRDGVRLRHGLAVDPHGGRDLQHLLPRHQRPPRHPPDRRHPDPAADRGAADHEHAARAVRRVHRMAHLPRRRRADPHLAQRQRVREGLHRPRRRPAPRRATPTGEGRRWLIARVVVGVLIGAAGIVLLVEGHTTVAALRPVGGAVLVVAASVIIFGPWWLSLVRDLIAERQARALAEERAQMAAHVHDSVLQTLALIQRSADDPQHVVRLARAQERELRAWLFEGRPPGRDRRGRHHAGRGRRPAAAPGGGRPRDRGAGGHGGGLRAGRGPARPPRCGPGGHRELGQVVRRRSGLASTPRSSRTR